MGKFEMVWELLPDKNQYITHTDRQIQLEHLFLYFCSILLDCFALIHMNLLSYREDQGNKNRLIEKKYQHRLQNKEIKPNLASVQLSIMPLHLNRRCVRIVSVKYVYSKLRMRQLSPSTNHGQWHTNSTLRIDVSFRAMIRKIIYISTIRSWATKNKESNWSLEIITLTPVLCVNMPRAAHLRH